MLNGVRRICEEAGDRRSATCSNILHGTTVATNAVLESKGARVGLITTQGFKQILHLARSQTPGPARGLDHHDQARPAGLARGHARGASSGWTRAATRSSPVDEAQVEEIVRDLVESGVESLTVGLINSYVNPAHEEQIGGDRRAALSGLPGDALVATCCRSSASTSGR